MKRNPVQRIALACFALALALGAARYAQAQEAENPPSTTMGSIDPYLMDRDAEIAMARSAAPPSIAKDATVLVLGRHGYETAVKGKNGFVCLVGRSWDASRESPDFWDPKVHGPVCRSAPSARSSLPIYLKKTELALAGRSNNEIEAAITDSIANGELPTPEPGSLSYMMSKQGYLNAKDKGPWLPHVMIVVPEIDPRALGAAGNDVPLVAGENKIARYTTINVPVSHWSDGTSASEEYEKFFGPGSMAH